MSSGIIYIVQPQPEMLELCMHPGMPLMQGMFPVTLTSSEFLDKVLDAYLIVGALEDFGMKSVDDEPSTNQNEGLASNSDEKSYVLNTITKFVEEHVVHQIPEVSTPTETKQLQCQICGKKYVRPHALQAHEKKIHAIEVLPTPEQPKQDHLYNYTHQLLIMLLLRANHDDAIKLGDGARVIRLYKYFMLFFKVSKICNCPATSSSASKLFADTKASTLPYLE